MELQNQLKRIGLSKSESSVYLFLLEQGVSTPAQIAHGTGILRTNCYHVLENLMSHGLIREQIVGTKRKAYLASDPESLYQSIEQKREVISQILPDLRGLYTTQKNKPKIEFYDGIEQVKEAYWRTLEGKELFAIGSPKSLDRVFPSFYPEYVRELKARNIVFHDIVTQESKEWGGPEMLKMKGLYDVAYLPAKYKDNPTDMLIWDDHVLIVALEEPFFATVVTNPLIAKTMRMIFSAVRDGLV